MAEPQKTLTLLAKAFDQKKITLTRGQLHDARDVLKQAVLKDPEGTQLPWWLERVEQRINHLETGQFPLDPERPAKNEKEKKAERNGAIAVVALFVLVVGGCTVAVVNGGDDDGGSSASDNDADEIGASLICEQFVEDRLRSPGTADFAGYGDQTITGGPSRFTVRSFVDSENGFGALLRTTYTCTVSSTDGETWNLLDLTTSED